MADLTLTRTRIQAGIWEGVLTAQVDGNYQPEIGVTHVDQPLDEVHVIADSEAPKTWHVRVPIPPKCLSDGVQTFVITDQRSGTRLDSFTILAGEPLEDDIRAELDLLRAELDMLKRAFRRHCVETGG